MDPRTTKAPTKPTRDLELPPALTSPKIQRDLSITPVDHQTVIGLYRLAVRE